MLQSPVSRKALTVGYWVWRSILSLWYRVDKKKIPPYVVVELSIDGTPVKLLHPAKTAEDLWRARRIGGREPEVESVFKPKSGWTILDVGAHIGYYTLKSSKIVGEGGRVVSVEPYQDNYELLLKNVELNSCSNVRVIKKAVTSYNGSIRLYFGTDSGHNTVLGESVFATNAFEDVDAVTLDSLLKELGIESVDLAKIDVEGNEINLLEGARGALTEGRIHRLVIEVHSPRTANNPVHKYLRDLGYEVTVIKRRYSPIHVTRHHIYVTRPSEIK